MLHYSTPEEQISPATGSLLLRKCLYCYVYLAETLARRGLDIVKHYQVQLFQPLSTMETRTITVTERLVRLC